jgi:hypothetical protein
MVDITNHRNLYPARSNLLNESIARRTGFIDSSVSVSRGNLRLLNRVFYFLGGIRNKFDSRDGISCHGSDCEFIVARKSEKVTFTFLRILIERKSLIDLREKRDKLRHLRS